MGDNMPTVVVTYKEKSRELLEICSLDSCHHEVGRKIHYIFEFPRDQDKSEFIQEVLEIVAKKDE